MFDLDSSSKLGALIGLVLTFRFAFFNLRLSHQKKFKEDYTHAKEFFGPTATPAQQAYIKELGYHAVAGTNQIEGDVVQHLINLDPKGQALQWYPNSKGYLSTERGNGALRLSYTPRLQKNGKLLLRKIWYSAVIIVSFFGVGMVMLAYLMGKEDFVTLPSLLPGGLGWGLGFYLAVQELGYLIHAEKIIDLQESAPLFAPVQIPPRSNKDQLIDSDRSSQTEDGVVQIGTPTTTT